MPVASIARPINPPSASISRTRCPLAVPPTAGLHGMCATPFRDSVHNPTWQPRRAAAYAASTPACPAPMTITSNFIEPLNLPVVHTNPEPRTPNPEPNLNTNRELRTENREQRLSPHLLPYAKSLED